MSDKRLVISDKRAALWVGVRLLLLLLLCGCERREITYYLESELEIRADWSASLLDEDEERFGATTVFFPVDVAPSTKGGDTRQVSMGTRESEKTRLPEGTYHAIIFNRSPEGFASIRFTGDTFDTYTASARQVETRTDPDTRTVTRVLLSTPEELAADLLTGFTVTEGMLGNYSETSPMNRGRSTAGDATRADESDPERYTLRFTPRKLTLRVTVDIHLEGIHNLRSVVATLDGVSESILLCVRQPSTPDAVQQFELSTIAYDEGSPFNGTLSGEFNVFGIDTEGAHTLRLKMLLVDNKTVVEQALPVRAEVKDDGSGNIVIVIHGESAEPLPNVKPEGDPDSGFDAGVDGWGDPVEKEIPLN